MSELKSQALSLFGQQQLTERLESRTGYAFAEGERQGLMLAAKVRTIALLFIFSWQVFDYSGNDGLAYVFTLLEIASFALLGVMQFICARYRIGIPALKYVFVLIDCAWLAIVLSSQNPFEVSALPPALAMEGSRASYFYVFLMQAAFSLRPQLVLWAGLCIISARTAMLMWFLSLPDVYTNNDLPEQTVDAYLAAFPDTNFIFLEFWKTEIVVTLILAAGLAVVVNRSRRLVESRAVAERTRASLARYFSPNVADHIADQQQLLGSVREQEVAVLFVDIVGFTKMCEQSSPEEVIMLLRDYHDRLGEAVFDNHGTLDKYMGDGLMATFGTPVPKADDARNALQCALDMIEALKIWNAERAAVGAQPIRIGIGLHYGMVIAGDIGNERRLEYSVIGDTVNIANRLEQLTRDLPTSLVVSDRLIGAIPARDAISDHALFANLNKGGIQQIRGRESGVAIWTYSG